jgi:hypothetical protein
VGGRGGFEEEVVTTPKSTQPRWKMGEEGRGTHDGAGKDLEVKRRRETTQGRTMMTTNIKQNTVEVGGRWRRWR